MQSIVVFASGRGTNFEAICKASNSGKLACKVLALVCNDASAGAIDIAKKYSIPVHVIPHSSFLKNRRGHEQAILEAISLYKIDWIVLAGYMRILSKDFIQRFSQRIVNIHPSLLPEFPGTNAYEQAFEAFQNKKIKNTGVTVHLVNEEMDAGPIVLQKEIDLSDISSLNSLVEKGLKIEHQVYVEALNFLFTKPFVIQNNKVIFNETKSLKTSNVQKTVRMERILKDSKLDAKAQSLQKTISLFAPQFILNGVNNQIHFTEVFWLSAKDTNEKDFLDLHETCSEVLTDAIHDVRFRNSFFPDQSETTLNWWCIEKRFLPGVTDNPGKVLAEAASLVAQAEKNRSDILGGHSGCRVWILCPKTIKREDLSAFAAEFLYNPLIETANVYDLKQAQEKDAQLFTVQRVAHGLPQMLSTENKFSFAEYDLVALSDDQLIKLSEEKLWALSLEELKVIQFHFGQLKRKATDVEMEVLAQTWSEHCKHKIFAAEIEISNDRSDIVLPKKVNSVFKSYIKRATQEVSDKLEKRPSKSFLKSVFEDNAGIFSINEKWDCAIKVETHNSPSALDPYGGALTGIVGVNRDILGAGLGAYPIANLDVFCVGPLDYDKPLPPRLHHPRRILEGVRKGVEDGGNKSGIPTVTGAVVFDERFLGKPLVFCGTVGLLPNGGSSGDLISKTILPGDKVVMAGGRIGKDGIHGATFSSLELNETSPVSAVQLGDPLTQKRVWDFLIEARDLGYYRAVTDNGAGGLSSSIGELARLCGKKGGARIDVSKALTKYPGLQPFELVVSESQERMSFAVIPEHLSAFLDLAERRTVECSVLGDFVDSGSFDIFYSEKKVASLDMEFLHEGVPQMKLKARVVKPGNDLCDSPSLTQFGEEFNGFFLWLDKTQVDKTQLDKTQIDTPLKEAKSNSSKESNRRHAEVIGTQLLTCLKHPNIRSRKNIVQKYDHEVQARSVRKPYGTPEHAAPNDGAVLRLDSSSYNGIAVALGLAPTVATFDARLAACLAVDEAIRNAVASGMDPEHAVLVDNFCWPDPLPSLQNPDAEKKLGDLVLTCQVLYEAASELELPFVSGKDSMKNDYRMGNVKISVPPTILVTTMGKVHDVRKSPRGFATSSDLRIFWVFPTSDGPKLEKHSADFKKLKKYYARIHKLILDDLVESCHDISEGGALVATAEMCLGAPCGANIQLGDLDMKSVFTTGFGGFVIMIEKKNEAHFIEALKDYFVVSVGETTSTRGEVRLSLRTVTGESETVIKVEELEAAYEQE